MVLNSAKSQYRPDMGLMERGSPGCLLDRIGNTPLISIPRLTRGISPGVDIYAKAEWVNPGGSVKDRAILRMIEEAEREGSLTQDQVLLDSSSGNSGIAYAMHGAVKGYAVELVMSEGVTEERKRIVRAYGAKIHFSDPMEGSDGARKLAENIYASAPERYAYLCQYDNPANWKAHYETTGFEIFTQTHGQVTHFVAGVGTGGTITGVGRCLKAFHPQIKVYGVEPDDESHRLEGLKYMPTAIRPKVYDPSIVDETIRVETRTAYEMMDRLAREEGLFVGPSSGAAMVAAIVVGKRISRGIIVTVFPDAGYRYLSQLP